MQRCMGCMREFSEEYDVCPHCGYIVGTGAQQKYQLEPGVTLQNRYVIGKVIGQGGFGITYIGWDPVVCRAVAIKEYMPKVLASRMTGEKAVTCYSQDSQRQFEDGIRRIAAECKTISLFHDQDSVVPIYDFVQENGTAYIIMYLCRGKTVKEYVTEHGPMPFAQAMKIMEPILRTLQAMHEAGVLHRDVAPDNIILCDNGKVKLLDFGAARTVSAETDDKTRTVICKHGFSPIEQYASAGNLLPCTDVYAACATMYYMLIGSVPPSGPDRMDSDDEKDLRALLDADIPSGAKRALIDGMRKAQSDRIQTAGEMLRRLLAADGQTPPPPKPPKRFLPVLFVVLLICACAAGLVIYRKTHPPVSVPDDDTTRVETRAPQSDDTSVPAVTVGRTTAPDTTQPTTQSTTQTTRAQTESTTREQTSQSVMHAASPDFTSDSQVSLYCPPGFNIVNARFDDVYFHYTDGGKSEFLSYGSFDGTGYFSDKQIARITKEYKNGPAQYAKTMLQEWADEKEAEGLISDPSPVTLRSFGHNKWYIVDYENPGTGLYETIAVSFFNHYLNRVTAGSTRDYLRTHELLDKYVDTPG